MSEVYVLEPPTKGKVVLHTSHGDLDVELWSKECPKACRNFVQLCLEGFYKNLLFHRIIKEFLIQAGDPTGTGLGGESIYGPEGFPKELHSRLKFSYRGLVGVSPVGEKQVNGSQFFITLARADALNGKNTLFGKIVGHTVYNLLKIGEVEVDKNDVPIVPVVIKSVEIPWNPFNDIIPRLPISSTPEADEASKPQKSFKRAQLSTMHQNRLSFLKDADEEEEEEEQLLLQSSAKKMKSAHDLLDDPRLLKESASLPERSKVSREPLDDSSLNLKKEEDDADEEELNSETQAATHETNVRNLDELKEERGRKRREQLDSLKQSILSIKSGHGSKRRTEIMNENAEDFDLLNEEGKRAARYQHKKRNTSKRQREQEDLSKLLEFQRYLRNSQSDSTAIAKPEHTLPKYGKTVTRALADFAEDMSDDDNLEETGGTSWLSGSGLKFPVDSQRAYELDSSRDNLKVIDPFMNDPTAAAAHMRKIRNERMKPSMRNKEADNNRW